MFCESILEDLAASDGRRLRRPTGLGEPDMVSGIYNMEREDAGPEMRRQQAAGSTELRRIYNHIGRS